ncbi:hypothetical protein BFU36_01015 [Sulfolobus sp. A20]|uniref:hypothetical protein n=1 Tax=Sulfolobaceae TaxID=118883 RepID=UPI0008461CE1|nr:MULTISPECIES: hypothetical protein [unclassified Sulfolobus]TRM75460.1 hypothetical protein DJ523_02865 [Sulfolobus sp. E5]TRM77035.1 hypothetical protein DJ532_06075 [Sulfolobus sp. A20-N-F8]TRM81021.1 hypothetical protein DJ524_05560 [Sulfolobus sp. D5]TRM88444.1 hypothetical protein DJ529_05230 [Sulfolobus sp. C3]TRM98328.1 hypothetical protein DJ527_10845 [Sulfolobus sp. F1]
MVNLAIWLDGVILDIDLTDHLYNQYKGMSLSTLPVSYSVNKDWSEVNKYLSIYDMAILSPYDKFTTEDVISRIRLEPKYVIYNQGKTKPSPEPYKLLFSLTKWDPLDVVTICSSPLDLLSARFYDSRIKIVCVKRNRDCSKYSPFIYSEDLLKAYFSLKRLKILQ